MVTRNRVGTQSVDSTKTTTSSGGGTGGGGGGNTSTDNRIPKAPTALAGNPALFYVGGVYHSNVTLTWTLPNQATDGTAMTPASTQVYVQQQGSPAAFHQISVVDAPDASVVLQPFDIDTVWLFKVRCVSSSGKLSAFSAIATVHMAGLAQGAKPPVPSAPDVISSMTMVTVTWDGKALGGGAMTPDTDHVFIERSNDVGFTTGVVGVGAIIYPVGVHGSYYIDGPLPNSTPTVPSVFYYRFTAVSLLGVLSDPGPVSPVTISGVTGIDINDNTIDAGDFTDELEKQINDAIASTTPNTTPGAHIFTDNPGPPTGGTVGDLWFAPPNNDPRILTAGGAWVSYRDYMVSQAFSGPGQPGASNTIVAPYLLPSVVRGQFFDAYLITADKLAAGTITADSGVIGSIWAGVITSGSLSADRISAHTLDSSKLIVADLTNLVDEGEFDGAHPQIQDPAHAPPNQTPADPRYTIDAPQPWKGVGWSDSRGLSADSASGRITVADHPPPLTGSTASGYVWSAHGSGGPYDIVNTRVIPASDTDQYYGQCYVRKTATGTTGKVTLALRVDYATAIPPGLGLVAVPGRPKSAYVPLASYTFTTADPITAWIKISGQIVPPLPPPWDPSTGAPPPLPNFTPQVPAMVGAVSAVPVLHIDSTLGSGQEVQFASVSARRKNTGQLIVDGTILANNIAAGAITAAQIAAGTIQGANIFGGTITGNLIAAHTITVDAINLGTLSGQVIAGATLRSNTATFDYTKNDPNTGKPPLVTKNWPALEITANDMAYYPSAPPTTGDRYQFSQFGMAFGTPTAPFRMWLRSGIGGPTLPRWELDMDGFRLYDAKGNDVVNLHSSSAGGATPGSAEFTGSITASTVTASTFESAPTPPYIHVGLYGPSTAPYSLIQMMDASSNEILRFRSDASAAMFVMDSNPNMAANTAPRFLISSQSQFTLYGRAVHGVGTQPILFDLDLVNGSLDMSGNLTSTATITGSQINGATVTGGTVQTNADSGIASQRQRIAMWQDPALTGTPLTHAAKFQVTDYVGNPIVRFIADTVPGSASILIDSNPEILAGSNTMGRILLLSQGSSAGLSFYDKSNNLLMYLDANHGSASFTGDLTGSTMTAGLITGTTIRTTNAGGRIEMNASGIYQYIGGSVMSSWTVSDGWLFRSDTSGARIQISTNGIFMWDSSGAYTMQLNASTGNVWIKGTIVATSGSFTGTVTATSGSFTGAIYASTGTFTGTITASTFVGTMVGTPTWPGGTYNNPVVTIGTGVGIIRTSTGPNRIEMRDDALYFYSSLSGSAHLSGIAKGDPSTNTLNIYGYDGSSSASGILSLGYNGTSLGHLLVYNTGSIFSSGIYGAIPTSAAANVNVSSGGYLSRSTSSLRYKTASAPLDLHPGLLAVRPATWLDRPNAATVAARLANRGASRFTGFTAEDLDAAGLRDAVLYDRMGRPDSIMIPALLAHAVKHIQALDARVKVLEGADA